MDAEVTQKARPETSSSDRPRNLRLLPMVCSSCCGSLIGDTAAFLCCKPASASGVAGAAAVDDGAVLTQGSSVDAAGLLLVARLVVAHSVTTNFHLLSGCCTAANFRTAGF